MNNKLVDNKLYSLFKTGTYSYKLFIKGEHMIPIYSSLLKTNILPSAFYNSDDKMLYFSAEKIYTLKCYLEKKQVITEPKCIKMIDTLTRQIKYLEEIHYAYYGHNVSDILVINNDIFININANNLLPISNNFVTFLHPFEKPYFVKPEISKITTLPSKIHYKSSYYSLAALIIYSLLNKNLSDNDVNVNNILKPIFYTKIFWFLKRCLYQEILLLI